MNKKRSLALGILLGVAVVVSLGIVYIDTTTAFWRLSSNMVQLMVSNTVSTITVNTNWPQGFGFNTNNIARSFVVRGFQPATNATGNGSTAVTVGAVVIAGGLGGGTFETTEATGGAGGAVTLAAGAGNGARFATTNATGGNGAGLNLNGGVGGGGATVATNSSTGGAGGGVTMTGGSGGLPTTVAATNMVGGDGGSVNVSGGAGAGPTVGWIRKGGNGGSFSYTSGGGGSSTRTNGGDGGIVIFTAGVAGVGLVGGDAGKAGTVEFVGGAGALGNAPGTNSNGGSVFFIGGAPATSTMPGDVILARDSASAARGGVQVGPFIAGGSVSVTNMLGATLALDFPSTAAGTVSDLPIAVTGVESNNCAVALSVPWQSTSGNGGLFTTFNSNDAVYVRFANNNLVTAIDPVPGQFVVVCFRIR